MPSASTPPARGAYEEQQKLAADGLRRLAEFGRDHEINVIVENHGGLSSNGQWLVGVIKAVDLPNCGTLPDFGNFRVSATENYDRYKGVGELMPFAKAVSAKSHDFDDEGNETQTDYQRMMKIVIDAGYHGRVGIEYEGAKLSEPEGILATKKLLGAGPGRTVGLSRRTVYPTAPSLQKLLPRDQFERWIIQSTRFFSFRSASQAGQIGRHGTRAFS